jgi:hypothetical protein
VKPCHVVERYRLIDREAAKVPGHHFENGRVRPFAGDVPVLGGDPSRVLVANRPAPAGAR